MFDYVTIYITLRSITLQFAETVTMAHFLWITTVATSLLTYVVADDAHWTYTCINKGK